MEVVYEIYTFVLLYLIPFSQRNRLTCIQNNHFGPSRVNRPPPPQHSPKESMTFVGFLWIKRPVDYQKEGLCHSLGMSVENSTTAVQA